jgi:hypothetical protein
MIKVNIVNAREMSVEEVAKPVGMSLGELYKEKGDIKFNGIYVFVSGHEEKELNTCHKFKQGELIEAMSSFIELSHSKSEEVFIALGIEYEDNTPGSFGVGSRDLIGTSYKY